MEELYELGYTEVVIKKIKKCDYLNRYKETTLIDKIKEIYLFLIELGYTKEEIIKMTSSYPILYALSIDTLKEKIKYLKMLGYTIKDIIKMTKAVPFIYGYSNENIIEKTIALQSLGYTKEEVIIMTLSYPALFTYHIDNIKKKINELMELNYTYEEIMKMTKLTPAIFGYSTQNLKEKIEFYDSIGLHEVIANNSNRLMTGVDLTYARYEYYKSIGKIITPDNYLGLFMGQKQFEKKYKITKEELLKMYSYDKYMEDKNNGRTI